MALNVRLAEIGYQLYIPRGETSPVKGKQLRFISNYDDRDRLSQREDPSLPKIEKILCLFRLESFNAGQGSPLNNFPPFDSLALIRTLYNAQGEYDIDGKYSLNGILTA